MRAALLLLLITGHQLLAASDAVPEPDWDITVSNTARTISLDGKEALALTITVTNKGPARHLRLRPFRMSGNRLHDADSAARTRLLINLPLIGSEPTIPLFGEMTQAGAQQSYTITIPIDRCRFFDFDTRDNSPQTGLYRCRLHLRLGERRQTSGDTPNSGTFTWDNVDSHHTILLAITETATASETDKTKNLGPAAPNK